MVTLASPTLNESYVEPSPYAWLRSRAPVPTLYAPACAPLYAFREFLKNRTSRARHMTDNCAEVPGRKCLICIEIWQVELESCVWRVSFHKYAYVHGDPIQGVDPTGQFLGILVGVGIGIGHMANELVAGGLIIGLLENAGRPAFDLRAMGLALIAQGEFELGFKLYDVSTAVIGKVFETMETIDGAIGLVSIGPAILVGALKLARSSPELAQTAFNAARNARDFIKNAIRRGRNPAEFFNAAKWVAGPNASYDNFLDALDSLHRRAEKASNGPKFDPPDFNNLGPSNNHGVYNAETNTIKLYKGHDDFTLAEELRHWEYHQNWLKTNNMTQSQFNTMWSSWSRAERELYKAGVEADVGRWMRQFGFTQR